jgi:hypothetical protein
LATLSRAVGRQAIQVSFEGRQGSPQQLKFLLGHSSIQTTERYLGSEQEIAIAVNDNLGL